MNICFITPEYHTEKYRAGGIATLLPKITHWLAEHGHVVQVCVPSENDDIFEEVPNITVRRFATEHLIPRSICKLLPSRIQDALYLYEYPMTIKRLVSQLTKTGLCDCLVSSFRGSEYFAITSHIVPSVLQIPSCFPFCESCNFKTTSLALPGVCLRDWMHQQSLLHSSANIVAADVIGRTYEEMIGRRITLCRNPMTVGDCSNGLSDRSSARKGRRRYLLFCGSLQGVKGPHVFAETLPNILDQYPDMDVLFAGRDQNAPDGTVSMAHYIKTRLAQYSDQIKMLGVLERDAVLHLMRYAEVVVLPSLMDTYPQTLLEAMSVGSLVVGTIGASIDELIIDGVNGILVERNNIDALEFGIRRALSLSEAERLCMCSNAQERIRAECSPDNVNDELVHIFDDITAKFPIESKLIRKWKAWLAVANFWVTAFRFYCWGVPKSRLYRYHDLAEQYLPDYDRTTGMVKYPLHNADV